MNDDFLGLNADLQRFLNLTISSLTLYLFLVIGRFVVIEFHNSPQSIREFLRDPARSAATGMMIFCLGEGCLRGWTWIARFGAQQGWDLYFMAVFPWTIAPTVFGALEIIGLLFASRSLVENRSSWEVALILVIFSALITLFT